MYEQAEAILRQTQVSKASLIKRRLNFCLSLSQSSRHQVVHRLHRTDQHQAQLLRPALHPRAQLKHQAVQLMEPRRIHQVPRLRMVIMHNGPTIIKIILDITSKKMDNRINLTDPKSFGKQTNFKIFFDIWERNDFFLFYF
jgi:hypothetical protein